MYIYRVDCQEKVQIKPLTITVEYHRKLPILHVGPGDSAIRTSSFVNRVAARHFKMPIYSDAEHDDRKVRDFIAPAIFEESFSGLARIVYKEVVIRFSSKTSNRRCNQILGKHNLKIRRKNAFVSNQLVAYVADRRQSGHKIIDIANDCAEMDEVIFASPNFVSQYCRQQMSPLIPPQQWHLHNRAYVSGQKAGEDVNASGAWRITKGNRNITVAVLDDGVDVDHPNLRPNIKQNPDPNEPRDLCGRDYCMDDEEDPEHFKPYPKLFTAPYDELPGNDIHGTMCAGMIVAAGNGAFGIAPNCSILPVKMLEADEFQSDAAVADSIRYAYRHADILSCSWNGPNHADIEEAINEARQNGRGGKGSPVFCAAGNTFNPFITAPQPVRSPASFKEAIAVGASTDQGNHAYYSHQGPELWLVAPSGGGKACIFTTDVSTPGRGLNLGADESGGADGLHTNRFIGTSASTPLVAGVTALMLSVNETLDCETVKQILADTADKIDTDEVYDPQTGHNDRYGYGRVNAGAAVDTASRIRG
jgi:hypothetical protein